MATKTKETLDAFRVGYVAGYGLARCKAEPKAGHPSNDTHTPWTNFVPAWVDAADAKLIALSPAPHQLAFRTGFQAGVEAGTP